MAYAITRDGPATVPYSYTLANAERFKVESASAVFNGAGAGGSFIPCCSVYSQDGKLLGRFKGDLTVSAGDTFAEATFAPFLRGAARAATPAGAAAPSIATFYRSTSLGDAAQTIPAGSDANITWLHAALPSDGTITGPTIGNQYITFVGGAITVEFLYTQWDTGTFARAGVLGTNSNIVQADAYAFDNNGAVNIGADGVSPVWGSQIHPNIHQDGELLHAFVTNGDTVARDLDKAFLVIYRWDAAGYSGGIPGWPT